MISTRRKQRLPVEDLECRRQIMSSVFDSCIEHVNDACPACQRLEEYPAEG